MTVTTPTIPSTRTPDRDRRWSAGGPGRDEMFSGGLTDDQLLSRLSGLTVRQMRLLVLAVRSLTQEELAAALGVTTVSVASSMASLRRKLAVPPKADLAQFIEDHPALQAVVNNQGGERVSYHLGVEAQRHISALQASLRDLAALHREALKRAEELRTDHADTVERDGLRQAEERQARQVAQEIQDFIARLSGRPSR